MLNKRTQLSIGRRTAGSKEVPDEVMKIRKGSDDNTGPLNCYIKNTDLFAQPIPDHIKNLLNVLSGSTATAPAKGKNSEGNAGYHFMLKKM